MGVTAVIRRQKLRINESCETGEGGWWMGVIREKKIIQKETEKVAKTS